MKNQWPSKSILWQKLSQTGSLLMFISYRLGVLRTFSWFVSCSVNYIFFFSPMPVFIDLPQVLNTSLKGIKDRDPDLRSFQYIQKGRKKLNHKLEVFLSLCFHKSDLGFHKPTNKWLTYARTKNPHTNTHTQIHTHTYSFTLTCSHRHMQTHTHSHA